MGVGPEVVRASGHDNNSELTQKSAQKRARDHNLMKLEVWKLCSVIDMRHSGREKENLSCVNGE